jgi:dephospho-CoA kinase
VILRVGLTGGIASGKSTVAGLLGGLGCAVIDADRVVSDLYVPGATGYQRIVQSYGTDILGADGEIDRARLAERTLSDSASAAGLNGLIHPLVAEAIERRFEDLEGEDGDRIAVVEATLLLEAGTEGRYHRLVVVDLDPNLQLRRAMGRGMAAAEAKQRMARQMTRSERIAHADYVIHNEGTPAGLESEVQKLHRSLQHDLQLLREGHLQRKNPARGGVS